MNKEEIRSHFKQLRRKLPQTELEARSSLIKERFLKFLEENPLVKHIHIFFPITKLKEINTFPLLQELFNRNIQVYSSLVIPESNNLKTIMIYPESKFEIGNWDIPNPTDHISADTSLIQLVIVPLLAFDMKGHRLGYGKGYYDRFLGCLDNKVIKVGLSFSPPIEFIPFENHDVTLDFCITPHEIFRFG